MTTLAAIALAMLFGLLPASPGTFRDERPTRAVARVGDAVRVGIADAVVNGQDATPAGLCNPANICGDPDCSTAAKCTAGCFGNPVCATQCGGSPCNVGCNPGVCGAGCSQECNLVTCPQNACSTRCGNPNCKIVCGGSPCNGGCPNRCDPVLCPFNALCVSTCGGNSCNVGCSPCEAGCPERCNPVVCPTNALCLPACGGSQCNLGCDPGVCGSGCPQECDPILCPQNILNCLWGLLNTVSAQVDNAIARAQGARDRATETKDRATSMAGNMQDGIQNLTVEMRERIQDAVEEVQQAALDELAGAADFTNGPNSCSPECEAFRDDLITLLTSVQDISNALLAEAGINGQADFSAEIEFVEGLSGKALYPLYRVLQTLPLLNEDFLTSMSEIAANLAEIAPYITDTVAARGASVDVCRTLADNDELVEHLISVGKNIGKVAKGAKAAGSKLSAVGKRKSAGRAGVWGWAGVNYTGGLLERLGDHVESLGKRLEPIAEKLEKKLQYCVLKVNEEDIIDAVDANHQQFMQTDQAILNALKAVQLGNGADLSGDGAVDLGDYLLFRKAFGSAGG